ncbi:MAG: hypothetical protein FWF79_02780 [Defluviitaleaceae bacterium]|nr:hypothetical protein [Defluviitaleaceae bacterium]
MRKDFISVANLIKMLKKHIKFAWAAAIIFGVFLLPGCGRNNDYQQTLSENEAQTETYRYHEYPEFPEFPEPPANEYLETPSTENPAADEAQDAESSAQPESAAQPAEILRTNMGSPVSVNGQTVLRNGERWRPVIFESGNRLYLRLSCIAFMVNGTSAQFNFYTNNAHPGILIQRGYAYNYAGSAEAENIRGNAESVEVFIHVRMEADTLGGFMPALKINGEYFFALHYMGNFLGFNAMLTAANRIWINTDVPRINEYGRRGVAGFLSRKQASLPDSMRYLLYDLNGDGIPEIFIRYDEYRIWKMYVYSNGEFVPAGETLDWFELSRNSDGRIFSIEGGHHDGLTHVREIFFTDDGVYFESILAPPWERESFSPDEMYAFSEAWRHWHFLWPTMPGNPDMPLISIRPLLLSYEEIFAPGREIPPVPGRGFDLANTQISDFGRRVTEDFLSEFTSLYSLGWYIYGRFGANMWGDFLDEPPLVYIKYIFRFPYPRPSPEGRNYYDYAFVFDREGNLIPEDAPFFAPNMMVATNFRLYDFNNDGIPEIIIQYVGGTHGFDVLYMFTNGQFRAIRNMGFPQFFADEYGRILVWEFSEGEESVSYLTFTPEGLEEFVYIPWGHFAHTGADLSHKNLTPIEHLADFHAEILATLRQY